MENKEINILDYFYILYKARKYIFFNFVIVCFVAAGISMMLPKYYRSITTLLPPTDTSSGFGFSQVLSAMPVNIQLGAQGSPSEIFTGIMKSESLYLAMIEKYNLIEVYQSEDIDMAKNTLRDLTKISITKEGLIQIAVQDRDKDRAAGIANSYVVLLDSLNKAVNQRVASDQAVFLETQIVENERLLNEAETELKEFQLEKKAISPFLQERLVLNMSAEIEADILQKESFLKEYRAKSFTDDHPLVKELLDKVKIREEQLNNLRFGPTGNERASILVPLVETPELTMSYENLLRRVEIIGQINQLLQQQYEEAKIERVNSTSTVKILDKAYPAIRKWRPKRKIIVLAAGAASIFFSMITVLFISFMNRLTEINPEDRKKVEQLARFLRIDG